MAAVAEELHEEFSAVEMILNNQDGSHTYSPRCLGRQASIWAKNFPLSSATTTPSPMWFRTERKTVICFRSASPERVRSTAMSCKARSKRVISSLPPIGAPSSLPLANRWVFSTSVARRPLIPRLNTKARATRAACARNLSYFRRQEFFRFVEHRFQALRSLEQ